MTVHSHLRGSAKPIVFVPTYIGYERLMEGSTYVGEMQGKPKEAESIFGILKHFEKLNAFSVRYMLTLVNLFF